MTQTAPLSPTDRDYLVQRFVEDLPDCAMIILDVEGNVQTWNAGAASLLGYSADEMICQSFSRICGADELAIALNSALERGRHESITGFMRKDGVKLSAQSAIFPLYSGRENLLGFGALVHDLAGSPRASMATGGGDLATRRHSELILVVDDDDGVRQVARRQLTSLGYRVVDSSNGADALKILQDTPDVSLLFVDVVMPNGMGGREVAERARQMRPGLKVLYASGYFEGALVNRGDIAADVEFLVKPYRKHDLAAKVQEVLGATGT